MFFETMDAILPSWLKTLLYLAILIAQFLCGLATVTSASRMLFAFSRDGGMPVGSASLAKVSPTYRTPVNAIWTAAILEIIYVFLAQFISIGGTNIYTIVVNSTLVFLFLSFTIPIVLGMMAFGTREMAEGRPVESRRRPVQAVLRPVGHRHGRSSSTSPSSRRTTRCCVSPSASSC